MAPNMARAMRSALAAAIIGGAAAMVPGTAGMAATAHTVNVSIVAGKDGGMDFNGYRNGAMTITVPVGWHVVVHFANGGNMPHSLGVAPSGAHQQAMPSAAPVFPGATTANFSAGLPIGAKQTVTFEASKAGTYELICGCPGHAIAGMWATLVVSATADAPSVTPSGAATIGLQ